MTTEQGGKKENMEQGQSMVAYIHTYIHNTYIYVCVCMHTLTVVMRECLERKG